MAPFDIRRYVSPFGGLAGAANVIMQLSSPAVGYGVKESRVESGRVLEHPIKRSRTTFTYLAVALLGSEEDRRVFRQAVDHQHTQVYSTDHSPVPYDAFDPDLQLWVAACLYRGMVDMAEHLHGPLDDAVADELYAYSARLGTTLQVRPEMWPPDRRAFDRYWDDSLARARIDDSIRGYLMQLVRLDNLPYPLRVLLAPGNQFWTRGFLPPPLREQMGLPWSRRDEARFARMLRVLGRVESLVPPALRVLPFSLLLLDMQLRTRMGRSLV
jgi:uncharacterized protein (DUF2236 family)